MPRKKEPYVYKPPTNEKPPPFDAIISLENELTVQLAWRNEFIKRGDEFRAAQVDKDCAKIRDHIDRRLQERGLSPRYAPGAQWDGSL